MISPDDLLKLANDIWLPVKDDRILLKENELAIKRVEEMQAEARVARLKNAKQHKFEFAIPTEEW